jgi:competence protein ComEC
MAAGLVLAGRCVGRAGDALNSLALIAATIVACDPGVIGDAGFQLTFLATAGILSWGIPAATRLPTRGPVSLGFCVSAGAYLGAAPLAAWHFRWLAPVALFSNLAAAPLCAAMLATGYGTLLLHDVPGLGEAGAALARTSAQALLRVAAVAASFEGAGWSVPTPSPVCIVAYYLALFGPTVADDRLDPRARSWLWTAAALAVVWVHVGAPPPRGDGRLRAAVLDVGQGQAVALHTAAGGTLLIDAAGTPNPRFDPGERVVLPYLRARGVRRLDLLALSHGDLDHAGGAFAVLREMEVGELWLGPGAHAHPRLAELAQIAVEQGTAVLLAERGSRFERAGIALRVLGPGRDEAALAPNDRSLVLLAGNPPTSLLIAGDLEAAGEAALLDSGLRPRAEVLVLGHHGAADATGERFLAAVCPSHAVASCGFRNRFGHPHPATVRRVEAAGATLWRTDLDGMVSLCAGPDGWRAETTLR